MTRVQVMFNVVANVSAWLYTVCRECVSPDLSKESELNTLPAVLAVSGLYVTHAIVADAVVDRGDLLVRMNELFDLPCHLLFPLKQLTEDLLERTNEPFVPCCPLLSPLQLRW
eukprot:scaffold98404_cov14-Tisochrysis_lutea.AAC.1